MSNTTILTDLGRCEPNSAIAERNARGCWRAVTYDLGDVQGTMLIAGPETEAAPVTLPLDVEGWHAVHLGLWPQYGIGEKPHRILAKLSDDPSFVNTGKVIQLRERVLRSVLILRDLGAGLGEVVLGVGAGDVVGSKYS